MPFHNKAQNPYLLRLCLQGLRRTGSWQPLGEPHAEGLEQEAGLYTLAGVMQAHILDGRTQLTISNS